jgi:hypothetical protein
LLGHGSSGVIEFLSPPTVDDKVFRVGKRPPAACRALERDLEP